MLCYCQALFGFNFSRLPLLRLNRESYGVDIENTQTDGSSYCSDDDIYEDSFIDDDGLQVSQRSPVLSSKGMSRQINANSICSYNWILVWIFLM